MLSGLGYAVAAALLLGAYLAGYKHYFGDHPPLAYLAVTYTAASLWYLPVAYWTWPAGERLVPAGTDPFELALLVGTGLTIGVAIAISITAIKLGDVSYVTPLNKLPPVFVLPIEVVLLNQALGPLQVAGVVVVTAGVYAANYQAGALLAPFQKVLTNRPAQLALFGAVLFGVTDVAKRVLLQELSLPGPLVVYVTLLGTWLVVVPVGVGQARTLPRRAVAGALGMGAVVAVANILIVRSFAVLPASIASPVINAQAVVAVLLGGLVLRERAFSRRLVAAVLAVSGVGLVAVG